MKLFKAAALALGLLPVAVMASAAHATTATFDWSISAYGTPDLGYLYAPESGQLTATEETGGAWMVTSLSLTGSTTNVLTTADGADNMIYPQSGPDIVSLDTTGLTFTSQDAGLIHIYTTDHPGFAYTPPPYPGINPYSETSSLGFGVGQFTLTKELSAAPEPASWALMFLGVGGVGLMLRRSKKSVQGLAISA